MSLRKLGEFPGRETKVEFVSNGREERGSRMEIQSRNQSGDARRRHLWITILFCAELFIMVLFLKNMHEKMPLSKYYHYGASVNGVLLIAFYTLPLPLLLVTAFIFNHSRNQCRPHDLVTLPFWIVIVATAGLNALSATLAGELGARDDQQELIRSCWAMFNYHLSMSMACTVALIFVIQHGRALAPDEPPHSPA